MSKRFQTIVIAALALVILAGNPAAVTAQTAIAVAGFETDGSVGLPKADYDAIARALSVMLGTEISSHSEARVVPLASTGGARMGRVDIAAARTAATQAGAKYLVVGTLLDQYGDLRMEARLLSAATGDAVAVIRGGTGHAKREHLAEALNDLAVGLAARTELGASRAAAERASTPVDAIVSFGQGLRFEASGDRAKAAEAYRAAIKLAPALNEASAALRRVGG